MDKAIKEKYEKMGFNISSLRLQGKVMMLPASCVIFDDGRTLEEVGHIDSGRV